MSASRGIVRYSGVILSRNKCRKIDSNAFAKKEGLCPFLSATARRKKSKKSLSTDWAENLAESNKGLLLRPGAMVEGVERAAKRRMRSVSYGMTIYNLVKIWEAKTLKQTNRWLNCRFCQGSVQVVEKLRTWFHLDVPVAERNLLHFRRRKAGRSR